MGGGGSQKKKIIQEMFEVSAQFLDKGGGGVSKISSLGNFLELHIALEYM